MASDIAEGPRFAPARFAVVNRVLHRGMVYLLIGLLATLVAFRLFGPPVILKTFAWLRPYHGSVGPLIIMLVMIRAIWIFINRRRRSPFAAGPPASVVQAGHAILHLAMFMIPAVSQLRSCSGGKGWWLGRAVHFRDGRRDRLDDRSRQCRPRRARLDARDLVARHAIHHALHHIVLRDDTRLRMVGRFRRDRVRATIKLPIYTKRDKPDVAYQFHR